MWQTIDTAPKADNFWEIGPRVLIFDPANGPGGYVAVGWCVKGVWCTQAPWHDNGDWEELNPSLENGVPSGAWPNPTHWMPLPEPPKVDWEPKDYDPAHKEPHWPDGTGEMKNAEKAARQVEAPSQ